MKIPFKINENQEVWLIPQEKANNRENTYMLVVLGGIFIFTYTKCWSRFQVCLIWSVSNRNNTEPTIYIHMYIYISTIDHISKTK